MYVDELVEALYELDDAKRRLEVAWVLARHAVGARSTSVCVITDAINAVQTDIDYLQRELNDRCYYD